MRPAPAILLCLVTACGGSVDTIQSERAAVVRDSAGIRIVHNPSLDGIERWQLGEAPALVIGGVEEYGGQPLFRVSSATRFPSGLIAIADEGTSEIYLYSPDGMHIRTLGRAGGGPGEFQGIGQLEVLAGSGDTIAVAHSGFTESRMVFFSLDGEVLREIRPPAPAMRSGGWYTGRGTRNGIWFAMAELDLTDVESPDVQRRVARVMRQSLDSHALDTVAEYPGSTYFHADVGPRIGLGGATAPGPRSIQPLLSPRATLGAGGDTFRVAAGDQALAMFDVYDESGVLRQRTTWDASGREPSARDIELACAAYVRRFGDRDPQGTARSLDVMPEVRATPVYNLLKVDRTGAIWVQRYPLPSESTAEWWVFDSQGAISASITIPMDRIIFEIGADYILTRTSDELDVQSVELWPLIRGS